jgi:hypothetical protein
MIKKSKIIYMEEVMSVGIYNKYHLRDSHSLRITAEIGKKFRFDPHDTVDIEISKDEFNYIEFEFDDNVLKDAINNIFSSNVPKLYLTKEVKESISIFTRNYNPSYTLEGYNVVVTRSEGILFEKTTIECKKKLYSQNS